MSAGSPALVARPDRLRLVGQRRQVQAIMHQRMMIGMLAYAGIVAIIILRLFYLAMFGDHAGRTQAIGILVPDRGDIVDRDGHALARTIDAWSIALAPQKVIGNKLDLARKLAVIMPERDEAAYYSLLTSKKRFIYLRRRAAPTIVEQVNKLGEPGLALEREPDRLYPQTRLAAHLLGYTDIDGNGTSGVELAFEDRLSNASSRSEPLRLSISSRVQQALEGEIRTAMDQFAAIGAAGVVLDIHSGEVLAITSLPDYNPNVPSDAEPERKFNRATLGVYELGSTFKPFTVAMAMDSGIIKSFGQTYSCPKQLHIYKQTVNDTHPFGRTCTVAEIMKESSNIGTALIADQLGKERQEDFLKRMGFLDRLGIEIREKGRTLTPGNRWGPFETITVGYGHGIAVTPLHLAAGYATLFNGGIYRDPTIIRVGKDHPAATGRRVFSEETSYKMRALLRLVVTEGTGRKADAEGYRVGGKTGTAEKLIGGRYSKNVVVTTFAGVFPMDEPRYAMVIMLDEPKGTSETFGFRTAGWNVAPTFKRAVSRIAPMLGVRPDKRREANLAEVLPYVHEKD